MMETLIRKAGLVCLAAALGAAGLGCADSGRHTSAQPLGQMVMPEADTAPVEEVLTEAEQAVKDLRIALAAADKVRDAAAYGVEEVNRVGDLTVTRKLRDWETTEGVTGWHGQFQTNNSGSRYTTLWQSYRDGGSGWFLPRYDADGNMVLNVGTGLAHRPLRNYPSIWPWRGVNTAGSDPEGRTSSHAAIENHGLGAAWQGFEVSNTYEGAGTLSMRVFTDLAESNNPGDPFAGHPGFDAAYPDVMLDDPPVPSVAAGWDGQWLYAGDGLRGSLDGATGTFSCADGNRYYCGLETSPGFVSPGYVADVAGDPVIFTPDDGSAAVTLPHPTPIPVPSANYLSLGTWLFVPDDVTDLDAYDFGMFASGDDPFAVDHLQRLTGTADYSGAAAGTYADEAAGTLSPFSARVVLAANFGAADSFGTILGTVYGFEIEGGKASPLASLDLNGAPWRDERNNIFATLSDGGPLPGGLAEGWTGADVGTTRWRGSWAGKFFGSGIATADFPVSYVEPPSAFAGTFGATDGDRTFAGSFGARRQLLAAQ